MEDKQEQTIEKYSFHVKNRYRARGAMILDTDEGLCLMREYEKINQHFVLENRIKDHLFSQGMVLTDRVIENRDGEKITQWESGEKYIVYQWYSGDSCDYKKTEDLAKAAQNLGKLHKNLQNMSQTKQRPEESLADQYKRYNKELKRIYQFMKSKKRKNSFELCAISCFREFYEKAEKAREELEQSPFVRKYEEGSADLCHGAYNYHNLIFTKQGIATTNFECARYGIQLLDLAYFLRKVMEKNKWQTDKGEIILKKYAEQMTCREEHRQFLKTILSYPVKYRKLMNQYMNGKKSWISDKNMEKLLAVQEMEEEKENFLRNIM